MHVNQGWLTIRAHKYICPLIAPIYEVFAIPRPRVVIAFIAEGVAYYAPLLYWSFCYFIGAKSNCILEFQCNDTSVIEGSLWWYMFL